MTTPTPSADLHQHRWTYEGCDRGGSHKGEEHYSCNCGASKYELDGRVISLREPADTPSADARDALNMARDLICEAKGAEGPNGGFVTNHLDAAEGWLDKVEAHLRSTIDAFLTKGDAT